MIWFSFAAENTQTLPRILKFLNHSENSFISLTPATSCAVYLKCKTQKAVDKWIRIGNGQLKINQFFPTFSNPKKKISQGNKTKKDPIILSSSLFHNSFCFACVREDFGIFLFSWRLGKCVKMLWFSCCFFLSLLKFC